MREMAEVLKQAAQWAEWESAVLDDLHRYAQRFGCQPGRNIFDFVLRDALRMRGLTREQFADDKKPPF
jgi:hypothetical protein